MRPLAFTAFAVFAAAALAAAPAFADDQRHHQGGGQGQHRAGGGGGGPRGGGGGGGWRHGGGGGVGFAAPALILGLGAAAVAAGIANSQRGECGHYVRIYDDWGNYRGRRWVDEC